MHQKQGVVRKEAARSSEASVSHHITARRHSPEELDLNLESLKLENSKRPSFTPA
jgi:hypothetical protein